jgi:hypothetical protein
MGLNLSNKAKGWEDIFEALASSLFLIIKAPFMSDNNMFFKVLYHFARCPFVIQTKITPIPRNLGGAIRKMVEDYFDDTQLVKNY